MTTGFYRPRDPSGSAYRLMIVWDGIRFYQHLESGLGDPTLVQWAKEGFHPAIFYANQHVWVFSPGSPPSDEAIG